MKKILVAVDGSEHADKALEKAKELGRQYNSEIIILFVISSLRHCHPYVLDQIHEAKLNKILLEQGKRILEEAKKKFEDYPAKATTFLKCGDPAKEIVDKAEKENCDLIVMGSRGLNTISRAMLGSISNKVLNHSDISVLIVK